MHAGKSYWPELVGAKPLDAKAVILSENPHVDNVVIAVYPGIAPPDFCCNRVYVWIDRPDGTLVGAKPLDAKAVILRENPQVDNVMIVVYPGIAPPDFCCNRVYVWINRPDGTVLFAPTIG
uniref:Proteinase inhibitor n=1 Tax=Ananas comosus var. bracteatus TaxID=296719 RepID=A0A6V7QFB7_ANACO|nr:unnamed protein product [Ananas comosus var. bracteatus]